ncbi:class I SAM-dependent methyltransferase [Myxacorys almedinensis]|uniref:Methyltransferase domain-containing protein n=1 Tax=Myxacorys almedinensis A TaxID=2690445 RepID=A0A8J8CK50_9CYAN|nr:class I SAM-dependent methyltransferase [Myxacorys almedinensis]NDJ16280.1 methyltransferase domain-containing protein [Myxacorys almedinensis A]
MQEIHPFLNPHPCDPHYIARFSMLQGLSAIAPTVRGRVLDIGSGHLRGYEGLFKPYVDEYLCLDRQNIPTVDICSDCYDIPLDSHSFDSIVSTQALEHLDTPAAMLEESYRLLKPGGRLILTAPMTWGTHEEPYDFYRYTEFGIHHLLKHVGYIDITVEPLEGLMATIVQILIDEYHFEWRARNKKMCDFFIRHLNAIALRLDRKFPTRRICLTYLSVAVKPV